MNEEYASKNKGLKGVSKRNMIGPELITAEHG